MRNRKNREKSTINQMEPKKKFHIFQNRSHSINLRNNQQKNSQSIESSFTVDVQDDIQHVENQQPFCKLEKNNKEKKKKRQGRPAATGSTAPRNENKQSQEEKIGTQIWFHQPKLANNFENPGEIG